MKKFVIIFFGVLIFLPGCVYAAHVDGPYEGKVIDADTGEPVEGVVILGVWYTSQFSPAGATHNYYDAKETVTDKNGEFSIPGMGLRVLSNLELRQVVIFKAGFEHLAMGPWESLKKDVLLRKKIKWEKDKPIIPLRRWALKERRNRFGSYYVDIPKEKQRLLSQEIEKENREIGK